MRMRSMHIDDKSMPSQTAGKLHTTSSFAIDSLHTSSAIWRTDLRHTYYFYVPFLSYKPLLISLGNASLKYRYTMSLCLNSKHPL